MSEAQALLDAVSRIELDPREFDGLEIEQDKLDWYTERFQRCVDDDVPYAVNEYLKKLARDDVNALTRVAILHVSLQYLN